MSEIETLSHVDLLYAYANRVTGWVAESETAYYAEILRRMQACTRDDIPMHPSEYQR